MSTVGKNRKAIEQYIRNQLQEDYTEDQMSIKEYVDPFTGEPVKEGKWNAARERNAVGRLFDGPLDSARKMP